MAENLPPVEDPLHAVAGSGTPPMIAPGYTFGSVTDKISAIVLARRTPRGWWIGFGVAFLLTLVLLVSVTYLLVEGIGIWGNNVPVGWGFETVSYTHLRAHETPEQVV